MQEAEQRKRTRRGIGLMAGAVAFLFQISAFFWLAPAMALGAGAVPICTPAGIEYRVVTDDTGQPPGQEAPAKTDHGCPLCPLMAGVSTPPADVTVRGPVDLSRSGSIALPGERIAAGWFLATLQARGPPPAA